MVDRDTSRCIEQVCFSCKICPCGATTGVTSGVAGRFCKRFFLVGETNWMEIAVINYPPNSA